MMQISILQSSIKTAEGEGGRDEGLDFNSTKFD